VAAGIIEHEGRVLLVQNVRKGGHSDWSTPGGVVEQGEDVQVGLTREVVEETGLVVDDWHGPLYSVETIAHDMGWHLTVQVFRARSWSGEVTVGQDPDGIVVDAAFLDLAQCADRLAGNAQWVREPVLEWLEGRWDDHRSYRYHLAGTDRASMIVTRA